ncbi:class I SAM-dependent methyltransferase [Pseudotabrizicola alkalilacus]|uniref:Class I SAM-dependent methyltransferase n=1 Tax=Pseudotabrizicola alkalilacus TaxID=2305252 RepID=A0A411Z027_9RHOB|nr:class I SAM-dependent methyltransferase [Pseudotabrizicola alkalilacus]RGP36398.1 class I SAM-dependent methyltransferase [Pseudotabrizicola alkalilacus]
MSDHTCTTARAQPAAAGGGARFWNRFADRYAARPIKDVAAYEALLSDVAARLRKTDRVLEIGCGTGGTAIRLAPHVSQFTATDFSTEMIRIAAAKPAPDNLHFKTSNAETALDGGPFDAICAFNVLHLVDDLPGLLSGIHAQLRPGGLLISKTWCFADLGRKLRLLFGVLRVIGLFPPSATLGVAHLRQAIQDAGFEIVDQRVFGERPQNPYIVARRPTALAEP